MFVTCCLQASRATRAKAHLRPTSGKGVCQGLSYQPSGALLMLCSLSGVDELKVSKNGSRVDHTYP